MKNVPLHITPHHLKVSDALREFVRIKISALARFAGDILSAEIVLRGPAGASHQFSVTGRLALPGRDVHGHASHPSIHGAVNLLVARLGRLSRKRKTRLSRIITRPAKRPAFKYNNSLSN
jgi:putative sigma-54 modulation protein